MVAIVRQQRKLMATEAIMELGPLELTPGANLTSDDQLRTALRQQTQPTWSHLCSTCSMMKRKYGGVVDLDLLVYGVQGLSVVDASIVPLIPATHTSSTVYAVAEKVRLFIRCDGVPAWAFACHLYAYTRGVLLILHCRLRTLAKLAISFRTRGIVE